MERLLSLVRKLIDYGVELSASIRQRVATDPAFAQRAFGTRDLSVIIHAIMRGLALARALEAKLVERAKHPEPKPRAARTPSPPKPRSPRPSAPAPTADVAAANPALARLPTPEAIAAAIRRRPIGAVIVDICRDLGLLPSHKLWPEVSDLVGRYGGNLVRLIKAILDRPPYFFIQEIERAAAAAPLIPSPAGTGPP